MINEPQNDTAHLEDATRKRIEHFIAGYIGAALWSSNDESDPDTGGDPLDANYDGSDIAPDTMAKLRADCITFYTANRLHIHCDGAPLASDFEGPLAYREAGMAGHDFWLTRNGHGAGFWDGDWPEPHATALDKAAQAFGELYLYVGDLGEIHQG